MLYGLGLFVPAWVSYPNRARRCQRKLGPGIQEFLWLYTL